MGRRLFSTAIGSYSEYRLRLGRLADLWGHDPMLDTTEAEDLLDAIAAYMVDGGDLVGDEAEPVSVEAPAYARQEH
ncbi:hypothetical protein [Shumkonia mesophila]|uniref:hypothetical protein n=1 Tax=Shumkonia mesophila TaxID=2838854 RepID=UPI00293483D0|nr:hypothetical protein [Shumkonia mesophila]